MFFSMFVENCLEYDAIYDFSIWLRTGSNPSDIISFEDTLKSYFLSGRSSRDSKYEMYVNNDQVGAVIGRKVRSIIDIYRYHISTSVIHPLLYY